MEVDEPTFDPQRGRGEHIKKVLDTLHDGQLSILDVLLHVLEPENPEHLQHRAGFFANPSGKLVKLFDRIFEDEQGRPVVASWVEGLAVDLVSDKVAKEMEDIKSSLFSTVNSTTPESLLTWDVDTFMGSLVENKAPTLGRILRAAAQPERVEENNKITTTCNVIVTQLAKERCQNAQFFTIPFTLFLWANGASRQTIEASYNCGLTISFASLITLLHRLAEKCLEHATRIVYGPHVLCWSKINIKSSIFIKQWDGMPETQSGIFPILYQINADPADMRLSPMLARAQRAIDLTFAADVRPTFSQWKVLCSQLRVHVINILFKSSEFETVPRPEDPRLTHVDRHKMPNGHRTKQYPLRTSTIHGSSISSSIAVLNDVYINQLKLNPEELFDRAVPSVNDQPTNARIRGAKVLRTKDVNPFTRLQYLQLGFGLFHLCMNLAWALLHVHRGSFHQIGTLSYFFAVLGRPELGCERTDYHTLLSTLFQILDGIILNAWRVESGYSSLKAFMSSNPSADDLMQVADQIMKNHASPATNTSDSEDIPQRNLRLLIRDLLLVRELTTAISHGDFGRVEDILGCLTMIFCGAGSNNYSSEILHWIYNVKNVWTPKFADIMRDCMLVNFTGLEDRWMPVDLNIEHLIKETVFSQKGVYASWDELGDVSPAVGLFQDVRKQVLHALKTGYDGITNTDPDATDAIERIMHRVRELELDRYKPDRPENYAVEPIVDAMAVGEQKLRSSVLATFNRRVKVMVNGHGFDEVVEEDAIPAMTMKFASPDE